eukprot:TRINITY_DN10519_c0_g1_i1.p1 TRINITY_DN10519_c0_g1~~TRINITY_DN10519_c0_g1_i1.p1  ORF type:complete len:290 (-),score=-39.11 TRINITY_DN10519_c0_g1_i1:986-1855(-)
MKNLFNHFNLIKKTLSFSSKITRGYSVYIKSMDLINSEKLNLTKVTDKEFVKKITADSHKFKILNENTKKISFSSLDELVQKEDECLDNANQFEVNHISMTEMIEPKTSFCRVYQNASTSERQAIFKQEEFYELYFAIYKNFDQICEDLDFTKEEKAALAVYIFGTKWAAEKGYIDSGYTSFYRITSSKDKKNLESLQKFLPLHKPIDVILHNLQGNLDNNKLYIPIGEVGVEALIKISEDIGPNTKHKSVKALMQIDNLEEQFEAMIEHMHNMDEVIISESALPDMSK